MSGTKKTAGPVMGPAKERVQTLRMTNCVHGRVPEEILNRELRRIERGVTPLDALAHETMGRPPHTEVYPFPLPDGAWFWAILDTWTGECVITTYDDFQRALGEMQHRTRQMTGRWS